MRKFLKIQKAINTASVLHFGQTRKVDKLPFIIHPFSVALILSKYTDDENIISAGLLHDTLEDVRGYTLIDLKRDFGEKVAAIVKNVSEDKNPNILEDKIKTWQSRKEQYLLNLKRGSSDALMVACSDKIHNIRSIASEYESKGEGVWEFFNAPKKKLFWFYKEALDLMRGRINAGLVEEYEDALNRAIKVA